MPSRIAMPCPFANNGDRTEVESSVGSNVNYKDGFPQAYGAPTSNNGKFVTRKEMNGAFYASTADIFYRKAGGLNIFDQAFAHAVGGYPYGAVLDYIEGRNLHKVVSLVDNNKIDFTGKSPAYSDITSGTIDNINWAYCNRDDPTGASSVVLSGDAAVSGTSRTMGSIIGAFVSPFSGIITAKSGLAYNFGDSTALDRIRQTSCITGGGILVKKVANIGEIENVIPFRSAMSESEASSWHVAGAMSVVGDFTVDTTIFLNGIDEVGFPASTTSTNAKYAWSFQPANRKAILTSAGDVWVACAYISDVVSTSSGYYTSGAAYYASTIYDTSMATSTRYEVSVTKIGI